MPVTLGTFRFNLVNIDFVHPTNDGGCTLHFASGQLELPKQHAPRFYEIWDSYAKQIAATGEAPVSTTRRHAQSPLDLDENEA